MTNMSRELLREKLFFLVIVGFVGFFFLRSTAARLRGHENVTITNPCQEKTIRNLNKTLTPTISILMPIHNGIEYINESVASVLDQTYKEWELIIGVNGLLQGSAEYLTAKKYETLDYRIRVYDLYEIKGKSDSLNKMLDFSKGDWVAILDVDDIWLPTKLEKQIPFLSTFDVVGTKCVYFGQRDGVIPDIPVNGISKYNFRKSNPIINSSSLLRKCLAVQYGWQTAALNDYDLWMRLHRDKKRFYNVDEVLVRHRLHSDSFFNTHDHKEIRKKILSSDKKKS